MFIHAKCTVENLHEPRWPGVFPSRKLMWVIVLFLCYFGCKATTLYCGRCQSEVFMMAQGKTRGLGPMWINADHTDFLINVGPRPRVFPLSLETISQSVWPYRAELQHFFLHVYGFHNNKKINILELTNLEVNHEELGRAHDPNESLHLIGCPWC